MISAEMITGFCGDFCGVFCADILWFAVLFGGIDVDNDGVIETFDAAAAAAAVA